MLESPMASHGREVYGRMCAVCHGAAGEGYKADQAPALANAGFLSSVTDPFLVTAITNGRSGSTMSAWGVAHGGPLAVSDVAAVIEFMRGWQRGASTTLDERARTGDASRGDAIFARECAACHGKRGTGGTYVSIGNSQLLAAASDGFLRKAIRDGRPGTAMPAFAAKLGDQGIEDTLAHLRALPATAPPGQSMFAPPARPPPLPLGPVPLNPRGPEPQGFQATPGFTKADVVSAELRRGARMGILDARAPSDYAGEHIAGAVSVPFYDPEPYLSALPKDAWLVCYCGCPHAESGQLAQKLRAKGFTKVTVIDEGLRFWRSKGYATHTGLLP
jgi:cytochrome c oxidase cbb3-type subunit 3/ubiquinol-cytochrome c reductase cytochrome c subunit